MTEDKKSEFGGAAGAEIRWLGSDSSIIDRCTYFITEADISELESASLSVLSSGRPMEQLGVDNVPMLKFGKVLQEVRRHLEFGHGVQIIRGLPVNSYELNTISSFLWTIGVHLGSPIPQNMQGELISSVRDIHSSSSGQPRYARGYQTNQALPFHSDSCDIVGLLCLAEAQSGGASMIANAGAIHDYLLQNEPDVLNALYAPYYIDRRGEGEQPGSSYYRTPIFMVHLGRLFSRFNPGYVYAAQRSPHVPRLTELQLKAMNRFYELCNSTQFKLQMEFRVGDLQLLNNNFLVHARLAYQDGDSANVQRHLLRIWLMTHRLENIPQEMRDRYQDMERWRAISHVPRLQ